MKHLHVLGLVFVFAFCQPRIGLAAEFKKSPIQPGGPDLIEVQGDLALGDEKKFINVAIGTDNAIVIFHSRGGNLFAGIEIGRAVRLKGFSTLGVCPDSRKLRNRGE